MFTLKKRVEGIRSFVVFENRLLLSTHKTAFDFSREIELIHSDENLQELRLSGTGVIINSMYGKGYYISESAVFLNASVSYVRYPFYVSSVWEEDNETGNTFIRNMLKKEESVSFENTSTIFIVYENQYIRRNFDVNHIESFSFLDASLLWHFDMTVFGKWKLNTGDERNYEAIRFLGIWQNQLLVVCNSGTLLSLSVETGELLHRWDEYPKLADFYSPHFSACMRLDEAPSEVIGFRYVVLWRLDLQTKEIKSYSMKEEFEKYDIGYFNDLSRFPITDTHYFITVKTKFIESKNGHNEGIIAINKKTLKIDWHHFFDDSVWLGINVPEVTETHLYLRDNDNNLYIFEKE